jgi:LmbE family N-acetylglucosaminyl deacetylase
MSELRGSILAIFAHPDDEIGAGSTLAHYADAEVHIVLVCASRGEAATIYCDECATRENLAEVRTRELGCACEHLGVAELRWLDWPDGGIQALARDEAVGQVVALIREIRPRVIITHPENGLYPHPDHLAVWEIVRAAFHAAADPEEYPSTGPAWAADRLFTRAMPQSFFDAAPALAAYRVQLNGQQLPFLGTPDDQIDVMSGLGRSAAAAWDCHRSQHNPEGAFSQMPEALRRAMAENEHFVLAVARTPLPEGVDDDLLAGLAA